MEKKYLFIGGLHRSGTSILFKTLGKSNKMSKHENSNVSTNEGQHIQKVYPPASKFGGPGKFCFHKEYHYTEDCKLITMENKNKIIKQWSKYWNLSKPILVEKSPPNIIHLRFLQKLIDNSYFLVIIRHPVAVARATHKWNNQSLEKHLDHWIKAHEILYNDAKFIKNLLIIKYEDFCKDPYEIINKLEVMLDEQLDINIPENFVSSKNKKYLDKPIPQKIIDKYEQKINSFGYSLIY